MRPPVRKVVRGVPCVEVHSWDLRKYWGDWGTQSENRKDICSSCPCHSQHPFNCESTCGPSKVWIPELEYITMMLEA
jgi:hypothetical protein